MLFLLQHVIHLVSTTYLFFLFPHLIHLTTNVVPPSASDPSNPLTWAPKVRPSQEECTPQTANTLQANDAAGTKAAAASIEEIDALLVCDLEASFNGSEDQYAVPSLPPIPAPVPGAPAWKCTKCGHDWIENWRRFSCGAWRGGKRGAMKRRAKKKAVPEMDDSGEQPAKKKWKKGNDAILGLPQEKR